jgi:hypothetical protein
MPVHDVQLVNNDLSGMGEEHCNHTIREWNPYWEVDLGSMNTISEVLVWNRQDSPPDTAYVHRMCRMHTLTNHTWRSPGP